MKISSIQYSPSFKRVYALIGTREQIREATNSLINANGESLTLPATSIYTNKKIQSPLNWDNVPQPPQTGKNISFVVTGHEDVKNISTHVEGWRTLEEISKQIDKFIVLKDIAKQMREVRKSMSK